MLHKTYCSELIGILELEDLEFLTLTSFVIGISVPRAKILAESRQITHSEKVCVRRFQFRIYCAILGDFPTYKVDFLRFQPVWMLQIMFRIHF